MKISKIQNKLHMIFELKVFPYICNRLTTVAVSAYTRTLVGTTHCPSERATVSGKIDVHAHDTTYVFPGNSIFVSAFDFDWLVCIMSKASKRKRFQHSCRKEFQWLRYDEARNVIWCESYDGAKKRGFKLHNRNTFIESINILGVTASESNVGVSMDIE